MNFAFVFFDILGNSVTRKQLYRLTLLHTFAALQILDGHEVTDDERFRALSLFSASDHDSVLPQLYYSSDILPSVGSSNIPLIGTVSAASLIQPPLPACQFSFPAPPFPTPPAPSFCFPLSCSSFSAS